MTISDFHFTTKPQIILPLTAKTAEALWDECAAVQKLPHDFIEWRVDAGGAGDSFLRRGYDVIRRHFKCPLLTTLRTASQGGAWRGSDEEYLAIVSNLPGTIIDVEEGHTTTEAAVLAVHRQGRPVLMSYHRFGGPMTEAEIEGRLALMDRLGGDILKIACMAENESDVAAIFSAGAAYRKKTAKPVILIGMGAAGVLTRLTGPATFAAGANASAPGQVGANEMRMMLETLYPD